MVFGMFFLVQMIFCFLKAFLKGFSVGKDCSGFLGFGLFQVLEGPDLLELARRSVDFLMFISKLLDC